MTLEKTRKEIDALDDQIIALLERRMSLVDEVITAKAEENKNVYDADREYFILEKIKKGQRNSNTSQLSTLSIKKL